MASGSKRVAAALDTRELISPSQHTAPYHGTYRTSHRRAAHNSRAILISSESTTRSESVFNVFAEKARQKDPIYPVLTAHSEAEHMVHTAGGRVRDEKRRGKNNSPPPSAYPWINRAGTTFYTKYAVYTNATLVDLIGGAHRNMQSNWTRWHSVTRARRDTVKVG